ncbi:CBO0543 family protein [Paenibacillus cremeus]|uniref:DUF3021 domain-containing protein n=1 Tax=Paenibacillus cremeus TaxID=2163881 RepID=A0A559K9Y7_9BACL|nr:CBO0543 family protein [Paenibacillus cremeus]TVY08934.1 hypothetical protein FPZ49_15710 [Paenibacillus cremeus]
MNKKLKLSEIYTTVVFSLFIVVLTDAYAGFRFKAWGFFEVEKVEFTALFIILGIYPAVAAMIINWYPYESVWWKKSGYFLGWSLFSTAYEWLCVKTGILWHIHWNLYYSFVLYLLIYYLFLILHVRIYRWMQKKE